MVRKDKQSKPRSLTPVHPKLFTPYSLNLTIIEDLKCLADGRKRNLLGHREYFLFIWRNCLAQLGEGTERLPDREWVRSTLSAHRASFERYKHVEVQGYRLTKQWIIDALAITSEEQTKMQFLIGTEEKYDRNNKRRYSKRRDEFLEESEKRRGLIRQAKADPGLSQRQLAELFKCSVGNVFNALKD